MKKLLIVLLAIVMLMPTKVDIAFAYDSSEEGEITLVSKKTICEDGYTTTIEEYGSYAIVTTQSVDSYVMYNTQTGEVINLNDNSVVCVVEDNTTNKDVLNHSTLITPKAMTVTTPLNFNGTIASRWVYLAAVPYRTVTVTSQTEAYIKSALIAIGTYFISNAYGVNGLLVSTCFYLILAGFSWQYENDIKKYSGTYSLKYWEYGNYNVVNDYAYALVAYDDHNTQLGDVRHSSRLTSNTN